MSTEHATASTVTGHDTDSHDSADAHGHGHEHAMSDIGYVKVALVLALLTAAEVTLTYVHIGAWFLPILLILMVVKFVTVVSYFMHLKFDNKIFSWLFYSGLLLAIGVYLAALCTFQFFSGN